MRRNDSRAAGTAGQAMIEFMIGLVAVLALFAGLLQIATLTRTHTDVMTEARRQAGERALHPFFNQGGTPDFIRDRVEGDDEKRYTRDDQFTDGNVGGFVGLVVNRAASQQPDWDIMGRTGNQSLSLLHAGSPPSQIFGMVRGYDSKGVELLPAVRSLLYKADSVNVESEVWMTWCSGVY